MKKKKIFQIFIFLIIIVLLIVLVSSLFGSGKEFTIVVLPDSQIYSESYPEIWQSQVDWIIQNKNKLNIIAVLHVGDIVDDWDLLEQWETANSKLSLLDNKVPYLVLPGNHDFDWKERDFKVYDTYFGPQRFKQYSWYRENYPEDSNRNNFAIINDLGFISLRYGSEADEINWANKIIQENPDKKFIIITHDYLSEDGKSAKGKEIWESAIKENENVLIVFCGHYYSQTLTMSIGEKNQIVYEILANYQYEEKGGNGKLRYYTFSKNLIKATTYSPYLNSYFEKFNLFYYK
ncbi:MAG: metallophosphoesterase [archaeon]